MNADDCLKSQIYPLRFEASDFDKQIVDALLHLNIQSRWSAINSIFHLNRAHELRTVDPEMAFIRCITAEEEAAIALFSCLKRLCYFGADKILHRKHIFKNALTPFFDAIAKHLIDHGPSIDFHLEFRSIKEKSVLRLGFVIPPIMERLWPEPPLHMVMQGGYGENFKSIDFIKELDQIAKRNGFEDTIKYIGYRANLRNQILYASPKGIALVGDDIGGLLNKYKRCVFRILSILLMIAPYKQKQLFVQQTLDSFLKIMRDIEQDGVSELIDFDEFDNSPDVVKILISNTHGDRISEKNDSQHPLLNKNLKSPLYQDED